MSTTKPKPRSKRPPKPKPSDFSLVHQDLATAFMKWLDEHTLREMGWKITELQRMEANVARLVVCDTLTPEGEAERDRLLAIYKAVWLPRRLSLEAP